MNTRNTKGRDSARWIARRLLLVTVLVGPARRVPAGPAQPPAEAGKPVRGLKIAVAPDAPEAVRRAAQRVLEAANAPTAPKLLRVMDGGDAPRELSDSVQLLAADGKARAYNHLILVGLPDDPLIAAAWQRESRVEDGGLYIFGWGHLRGDIGEIESDRNPFLHSAAIPTAPFETEVVTLTGSSPAGVVLAVEAFLKQGLINGTVAAPGWTRPRKTILDRDPPAPDFALPAWLPARAGEAGLVGVSAGGEDEYRGVAADTGSTPLEIWRAKYYASGAWDGAGALRAFDAYSCGLHRRAYGNTLWMARFASAQEAAQAAPRIAGAAKLTQSGAAWAGAQPPYADGKYAGDRPSSGPLRLWQRDAWLLMSTLSSTETDDLVTQPKIAP